MTLVLASPLLVSRCCILAEEEDAEAVIEATGIIELLMGGVSKAIIQTSRILWNWECPTGSTAA